jgi:hypothetical protein
MASDIARRPEDDRPGTLCEAMLALARDEHFDPAKFTAMAEFQLKLEDRASERDLADAIQAIQSELPPVEKDGSIPKKGGTSIPFATFENIMAVLQPYLTQHGIAITYSSEFTATKFITTATARKGNATVSASVPLPIDEGPGRNSTQSHGSSMSYGKRYAVESLFNIIRKGKDDDGSTADIRYIGGEQCREIEELIKGTGRDRNRFLSVYGLRDVTEIETAQFTILKNALLAAQKSRVG